MGSIYQALGRTGLELVELSKAYSGILIRHMNELKSVKLALPRQK